MSETTVDEVTSTRSGTGAVPRATIDETVSASGAMVEQHAKGVEQESVRDRGGGTGRALKESTLQLLAKLDAAGGDEDPDDAGLVDAAPADDDAAVTESGDVVDVAPAAEDNVWQTKAATLEAANRKLAADNQALLKQPRAARDARDIALADAEQAYVDEGPVAAVRKFLSIVLNSTHDSKDVDSELSGLYTDLTARELNVPLEASHQALRETARARLALARDKRERKSEAEKTASEATQPEDAKQTAQAATLIESRLATKRENGQSFADDHPMLMALSEHLDGLRAPELLARVIKHELQIGTLDATLSNDDLISAAAKKVENHYKTLGEKFAKAYPSTKTDTAKAGDSKTATAVKTSNDQRQSTGAQKLSNASASVAPATSPKTKQPTTAPEEKPKFKTDKERREYALRHLPG